MNVKFIQRLARLCRKRFRAPEIFVRLPVPTTMVKARMLVRCKSATGVSDTALWAKGNHCASRGKIARHVNVSVFEKTYPYGALDDPDVNRRCIGGSMTIKRRVFISSPADRHLDKRRVEVQRAIWMGSMDSVTRRRRSGPLLGQMDHADHTDTWKDPRASDLSLPKNKQRKASVAKERLLKVTC